MRNATKLTIIPGYDDNDLTQVQIDYVPTSTKQTVSHWLEQDDLNFGDLLYMEDPIMIHSFVLAVLADESHDHDERPMFIFGNWVQCAAKETLELIKAADVMEDTSWNTLDDDLATFANLPEIGQQEALLERHTLRSDPATCVEETSHYWHAVYEGSKDFLLAPGDTAADPMVYLDQITNPKVVWAIMSSQLG